MIFVARLRRFLFASLALVLPGAALHAQNYAIAAYASTGRAFDYEIAESIALDASGNLYFGDANNNVVKKISPAGVITVVAGAVGQIGTADGAAGVARFSRPEAVAVDAAGNLYVGDVGTHNIRKISTDGTVSTLAGSAASSDLVDGTGLAAHFNTPVALAFDAAGNLFVSDSANSAVRKVTPAGVVTTVVRTGTTGALGTTPTPFYPRGLAFDRAGNLFIADPIGETVRRLASDGTVTIFAGALGQNGYADGVGTAAQFYSPAGLAVEASGSLVVGSANTLRRITPDGTVTTIAGQVEGYFPNPVDGLGGAARLVSPQALAFDAAGNLFLVESLGGIVRKGTPTNAPSLPILTLGPAAGGNFNRNLGERAALTLTAAASGDGPITFQWLRNGAPIAGATGPTFTIAAVTSADEGSYAVKVSNAVGAITSDATAVRVYTPAFEAFTSRHAAAGGSFLWSIATGAGQLVTVGTDGKILTSADGQSWISRVSGTTDWLVGVTFSQGRFVAVGDHGTILVSTDAVSWSRAAASGTTQRLNNVAFGGGRYVAVGEAGTIVTSVDAQTWTPESSGVTTWLRGLVYVPLVPLTQFVNGDNGTGRFYASGQNGVLLESAATGWKPSTFYGTQPGSTNDIEALADGPIGIGQDGTIVTESSYTLYSKLPITTPDGVLHLQGYAQYYWTRSALGLTARFRGLAVGAGAVFATGEGGTIAAAPGVGGPWSFIPSGTTANLVSGVFFGNSLFIVGENETILQSQPLAASRLINIATRGVVNGSASMLISGLVVRGDTPKTILLRAAGPALAAFNLDSGHLLAAPVLTLFDGANHPLASNRGWGTNANPAAIADTATRVGAFPFPANSVDSALLVTLPPGNYTAQIAGADGAGGVALVEAYDADATAAPGSRLINISTLGLMDGNPLIAGFVINGAAARRVLVRAVGPSLRQFGLGGVLPAPQLDVYNRFGSQMLHAAAWAAQTTADDVRAAGTLAGAFPLQEGSSDSAVVMTLLPGSYTVQVSGVNNATGLALVEVYDLP